MKKYIYLIMILITLSGSAQEYSFSISIDPKMLIEGPYKGKSNDIGTTFNSEFKFNIDFEKTRMSILFEQHTAISYYKTGLAIDHKFNNFPIKNFYVFTGVEISIIKRIHRDYSYLTPDNYRLIVNSYSVGGNLELLYRSPGSWIAFAANYNVFTAEQELTRYNKNIRTDGMFTIYFFIN